MNEASDAYSMRMLDEHQEREQQDLYARLKSMFLEDNPQASGQEFEDYSRELAKELRL